MPLDDFVKLLIMSFGGKMKTGSIANPNTCISSSEYLIGQFEAHLPSVAGLGNKTLHIFIPKSCESVWINLLFKFAVSDVI